jgi:hypothetical protein
VDAAGAADALLEAVRSPAAAPADPAEIADPAPYVYRNTFSGCAIYPSRYTFTLRRAGDRASLQVVVQKATHSWDDDCRRPSNWKTVSDVTYVGSARTDDKYTRLDLASAGGKPRKLSCRAYRPAIHGEGAELVRTPRVPGKHYSECSERGVWRPPATQRIDALACAEHAGRLASIADPAEDLGASEVLVLAPLPGVERIIINSDCLLQGSGYRRLDPRD